MREAHLNVVDSGFATANKYIVLWGIGAHAMLLRCPCSSEDRALASGARCGRSSRPRGAIEWLRTQAAIISGRGAAVARMVWDHEVVSSNLTAPTKIPRISLSVRSSEHGFIQNSVQTVTLPEINSVSAASNLTRGYCHGIRKTQLVLRPSSRMHVRPVRRTETQPEDNKGQKVKGWFRGLWPFGKGKKDK